MSNTLEQLRKTGGGRIKDASLKPSNIDKLDKAQRAWSDKVSRALGLQTAGSQGRMLAGAIASAQVVEDTGTPADKATAKGLRAKVIAAGTPPWKDTKKAFEAGSAKAHLDILTIPADKRALEPLDAAKSGVNQAFWINRRDSNNADERAFLCKPASTEGGDAPSGGLKGGEVAREALSGRAAQLLASQTGIDLGMPETHIVSLAGSLVPGSAPGSPAMTCSVQEYRAATGDVSTLGSLAKTTLKPEQVAALAVFDTLTLNTDRHSGNVLVDANNNLIPIDQGESFGEDNEPGLKRIKATLGGPHNALLGLPGAHQPMSREMLKKLGGLNADKYAKGLSNDNATIGAAHPSMKDAVSDGAIENARRAAAFTKLAVRSKPPLTPAAIQIALGNSATELLDPALGDKQFQAAAKVVIARYAPQQAVLREVCTAPNVEYMALAQKAADLGWTVAARSGAPNADAITDPVVLLSIIKGQIKPPKRFDDEVKLLAQIADGSTGQRATPDEALQTMAEQRRATVNDLLRCMAPGDARPLRERLIASAVGTVQEQLDKLALLMHGATAAASTAVRAELQALVDNNRLDELKQRDLVANYTTLNGWEGTENYLEVNDPLGAKREVTGLATYAGQGAFLPDAAEKVARRLQEVAEPMMVSDTDADLVAGLAAANANDPFTAADRLAALIARINGPNGANKALTQLQGEFSTLDGRYTIPADNKYKVAFLAAVQANKPIDAANAMTEIRTSIVNQSVLPTEAEFQNIVDAWNVPADNAALAAALQALRAGKRDQYAQEVRKIEDAYKSGAFGTDGKNDATAVLDALLDNYDIPDTYSDLASLRTYLQEDNLPRALLLIERLQQLAQAGAFGDAA